MSHGGVTASTRSDLDDISAVERDLKDRQEQFIRRERVYKMRLEELRKELAALKDDKISFFLKVIDFFPFFPKTGGAPSTACFSIAF